MTQKDRRFILIGWACLFTKAIVALNTSFTIRLLFKKLQPSPDNKCTAKQCKLFQRSWVNTLFKKLHLAFLLHTGHPTYTQLQSSMPSFVRWADAETLQANNVNNRCWFWLTWGLSNCVGTWCDSSVCENENQMVQIELFLWPAKIVITQFIAQFAFGVIIDRINVCLAGCSIAIS